ncbi:hypothetical protein IAU59_006409 [Kwoniella sp. CBS 9459]
MPPPRGYKRPHRGQYNQHQSQGYDQHGQYQHVEDQRASAGPSQYHYSQSYAPYTHAGSSTDSKRSLTVQIPPQAYIQAYEAQLVYPSSDTTQVQGGSRQQYGPSRGAGVIRYAGEVEVEGDSRDHGLWDGNGGGEREREVWADRHDIIHLLPSLTIHDRARTSVSSEQDQPGSPTGSIASSSSSWDSLPSDVEEKFALSDSEEIEAYEIAKKKKWMEALRSERLKEREKEDQALGVGGSTHGWKDDEEPSASILATMQHTARAIYSSPNPSILEMRILTNHAKDERFEFLKGRYKAAWDKVKQKLKDEKDDQRKAEEKKRGLGGLMGGYESSDDGDDNQDGDEDVGEPVGEAPPPPPPNEGDDVPPPPSPPPPPPFDDTALPPEESTVSEESTAIPSIVEDAEEEKRRLRRLRAEEWKRARNQKQK